MKPNSHLEGESLPTRLGETGNIAHLALWSPLLYRTRCGVEFSIGPAGEAERVEEPVSCITCMVKADLFEIPLSVNESTGYSDEKIWLKQVSVHHILT